MREFVLINGMDGLVHIHAAGCRDIAREKRNANGVRTKQAENATQLVAEELSGLAGQGFTENDWHIAPCAR